MPTMTQATIRAATIEDMPKVVACQELFYLESPWVTLLGKPDPLYAGGWMLERLMNDSESQLFVADRDGELIGLCGGSILPVPMVPNVRYAWEWTFWVTHEWRHTDTAGQLWQAFCDWAREHRASLTVRGRVRAVVDGQLRETLSWEKLT